MAGVFLSYAHEDAAIARALAKGLEASGLDVWWDHQLRSGVEYARRIERELADCSAVVVLWSEHSILSSWVRDEASAGRDDGKLVSLSIDMTDPPIGFRQYHTVQLDENVVLSRKVPSDVLSAIASKSPTVPSRRGASQSAVATGKTPQQEIRFCTAPDGVQLAYSCVGAGPSLVKAANWLNHLEFEWKSPIWRHWLNEFSVGHTLVRYDERGNGLSDRSVEDLSFEALVCDLETVADAAGVEQFDLLGISQGAAVAIAYAVRHPERVRRLVVVGGYASGWAKRGDQNEIARREALLRLTHVGWGQANPAFRQTFTSLYFPEATKEQADSFNELQRVSASPEAAERLQRELGNIDVREILGSVQTPTLVFHSRGDAVVPFEQGRLIAAGIPGARFVPVESNNHLLLEHEPAWKRMVARAKEFLA